MNKYPIATETDHEYFQELGALAEIGEITPQERTLLSGHLVSCDFCRKVIHQYQGILFELLPQLGPEQSGPAEPAESTPAPATPRNIRQLARWAALLVLSIGLAALTAGFFRSSLQELQHQLRQTMAARQALLEQVELRNQTIASLQQRITQAELGPSLEIVERAPPEPETDFGRITELEQRNLELQSEVQRLESERDQLLDSRSQLSRELQALEVSSRDQQGELAHANARIAGLASQIESLRAQAQELRNALEVVQQRDSELPDRLLALEKLLASRTLRVMPIQNVLNRSARPNAFARVLQGGSDAFLYVFGLTEPFQPPQQYQPLVPPSYRVWGLKESLQLDSRRTLWFDSPGTETISLGPVRLESTTEDRWVLQLRSSELDGVRYILITSNRSPETGPAGEVLFYGRVGSR